VVLREIKRIIHAARGKKMQQILEEENLIPGFFAVTQVTHEENHSQT